jgi:predicted DNA binding CopG/RHH family protein
MEPKKKTRFILRLPISLLADAKRKAAEAGEPLAVIVRQLLREWIADGKPSK